MKPDSKSSGARRDRAGSAALAAVLVFAPGAFAADPPQNAAVPTTSTAAASAATASKTHTLFMGVDLSILREKELHRVRDVSGGSFVIDIKGRPVFVPMDAMFGAPINLRVDQGLKLSRVVASVADLKGERAYTVGNDPRRNLSEQQINLQTALADRASSARVAADMAEVAATGAAPLFIQTREGSNLAHLRVGSLNGGRSANPLQELSDKRSDMAMAEHALANQGDAASFAKRLEAELAKELYDAMQVDFEVTAEHPLNNPYVVLITRFHDKDAKPGQVQNWIYAKSLNPIGTKPEHVHVLQGGFPRGYTLDEFQVHLFNQGQEVATNVAPKRVPLTANEAMLYLMIEYLAAHKNDSVPASIALTTLPGDFQTRLARGEWKQALWVKVSPEGRIDAAFADEACSQRVEDPALTEALNNIRFKPALNKGKPVESIARLKLGDLPQTI